jgi:hypothetical protein
LAAASATEDSNFVPELLTFTAESLTFTAESLTSVRESLTFTSTGGCLSC